MDYGQPLVFMKDIHTIVTPKAYDGLEHKKLLPYFLDVYIVLMNQSGPSQFFSSYDLKTYKCTKPPTWNRVLEPGN